MVSIAAQSLMLLETQPMNSFYIPERQRGMCTTRTHSHTHTHTQTLHSKDTRYKFTNDNVGISLNSSPLISSSRTVPLCSDDCNCTANEKPLGHSVLASQPVSQALGLSSLRQESPLLSIPPTTTMHLRASPLPVNSLPLIEFSLLFILLSALYPSHCYPPLHPLS